MNAIKGKIVVGAMCMISKRQSTSPSQTNLYGIFERSEGSYVFGLRTLLDNDVGWEPAALIWEDSGSPRTGYIRIVPTRMSNKSQWCITSAEFTDEWTVKAFEENEERTGIVFLWTGDGGLPGRPS